ncbi:hypothetical protein SLEP1_g14529 [Rubroshorea leprosula]|uniref:Uncharacterized protein n=1 Tax=Rubroshorea leprosula TaxID=152421 RepID=A0AAV5IS97_9ROSI|nr:hypothetical protein SLEP1_g14529 [Rubroshorea leprosula]
MAFLLILGSGINGFSYPFFPNSVVLIVYRNLRFLHEIR